MSDVRVGPEVVTDPAYLVSRGLEDFVTWTDTSAIRRHIMDYNELVSVQLCNYFRSKMLVIKDCTDCTKCLCCVVA